VPAIEPAIVVRGRPVIVVPVVPVVITIIVTMVVPGPVRPSVIGVVSAITPGIPWVIPSTVTITISIIWTIGVSVRESHPPSRVSKSHTDAPAIGTSGIPVHISVIGIIVVPSIIIIRKPPQIG
jgi:hypothetical protein